MAICTQYITIDLSTRGAPPVAYAHQNDTGRTLTFEVYNVGEAIDLEDYTASLAAIIPNANGTYSVITGDSMASGVIYENTIQFVLTSDYVAVSGTALLTIIITGSGETIRPINVYLKVQKSADGDDVVAGASDFPSSLADLVDDWITAISADTVAEWLEAALDEQELSDIVAAWLEDNPDATTTVEDDSLTTAKFVPSLRQKIDSEARYIFPRNFGADVLDGDCNLIIADDVSILIDCHRDVAWTQVETFLNDNDVTHLDYFILSHYHGDHYQNIPNLISNGYIDADTIVYLPPTGEYLTRMTTDYTTTANTVNGWFTTANIATIVPSEWDDFNPSPTMKVTFYNCDPTVWNQSTWSTDYNECSMLCLVEHGNNKSLYTGDAYAMALGRAISNGFLEEKIDLFKINHHGINYSDNMIPILKLLHPTYAVQPSSMGDDLKNNHCKNVVNQYLRILDCDIYASHNSPIDIIFESTVDGIKNTSGVPITYDGTYTMTETFYVDISTTNDVQDGSEDYPFKELCQALSHCLPFVPVKYELRLADGTYNESHETAAKNKIRSRGIRVRIVGTSSDESKVIIKNGAEIYDSVFSLNYVTLDLSNATFDVYKTQLVLSHVTAMSEGTPNTLVRGYDGSLIRVGDSCTFRNFDIAINVSTASRLLYSSTVFDTGTTAVNVANAGSANITYPRTITYTDVTNEIKYSDYAHADGLYTYKTGATTQTFTGRNRRAGFIILTNSSYANVYFYNCSTTTIYIKPLITQITSNEVTYTTSDETVTFECTDTITMFAYQF